MNNLSFRFARYQRLDIFKKATGVDNWKGLKVLDYGGNAGNLLRDGLETGEIVQSDYTCLDVDKLVLDEVRQELPEANWVEYDRYSPVYNPNGQKNIPFPFEDNSFDIVCAYSVHSHSSYEDLLFDLKEMSRVGKVVATSVVDVEFLNIVKMKREFDYGDTLHPLWHNPLPLDTYRYYVNGEFAGNPTLPKFCDFLITAYNLDWLQEQVNMKVIPAYSNFHQPILILNE